MQLDALTDTQRAILDAAQELAQTRGFNAFSFRDIAQKVGIRAPSIHHHFRSKGDLGLVLVRRYHRNFSRILDDIHGSRASVPSKLKKYAHAFRDTLSDGRMCLCGMMAVESETLTDEVRAEVRNFFEVNETWLAQLMEQGRNEGTLSFKGSAAKQAASYLALLEGSMLSARVLDDERRLMNAADGFVAALETS